MTPKGTAEAFTVRDKGAYRGLAEPPAMGCHAA